MQIPLSHTDLGMTAKQTPTRRSCPLEVRQSFDQPSDLTVCILVAVFAVAFNAAVSSVESNSIISPIRVAVRTSHSTVTAPLSLCRNDFTLKRKFILILFLPLVKARFR